ncbi:hypothetical protein SAMN04515666_103620 [Bosea lupini]|uniref:Uncharacterized protein n=1 Tax=Bosea lupini TaxID=1036779 RepID=A0A1H7PX82_9HYPH|nr:hypothetical protein [Bosea lupini]SEL39667.1 hypothetical protein SAMN04515666_103620 [Bosea lupini]
MASAHGKRRGALPGYFGRPLRRLKEIECLAHWRHQAGGYTDPVRALAVAAHALAALEGMRLRDGTRHPGLQFATAGEFLDRCSLDLTERDISEIVAGVGDARSAEHPFIMTDVEAGRLLDLGRDERTNLDIRTIEAVDEAPEDRAARMADWKRTNDRLRRQRATDKRRADAGLPALDRSAAKAPAPRHWEELGMSKATYHRRKAKGLLPSETPVSRTYTRPKDETDVSQTYAVQSETPVSRSFRRNIEVVRHDSLTDTASTSPGAAVQRPDPRAETTVLMLLGRGDRAIGSRVAESIDPDHVRRWADAVRNGTLAGDLRIELEFHAIQARKLLEVAS